MTWALLEFWKESEREDEAADNFEDQLEAELEESSDDPITTVHFGVLQPLFQSCFPEWRTVFVRPKPEGRAGTHIFKVTLTGWRGGRGGIWRRLAVPPDTSLEELAETILRTFALDNDHLYDFRYRDQRGNRRSIITPTPTQALSRRKSPWPRRIWRSKLKWNSRSTTETPGSSRYGWRKLLPARARMRRR